MTANSDNIIIEIAVATSRFAKKWKNEKWTWAKLKKRCSDTTRTPETLREYNKSSKEIQSNIKDVGGFVGASLNDGIRKNGNVRYRTLITLDIDYGTQEVWEEFILNFPYSAILYSTHKYTKEKPRYRLIILPDRPLTIEEYEPVCRYFTNALGIELFDHTTYQLPRLFYWPSTSKDADFVFECQDGKPFCVDAILDTYKNYRDVSEWPMSEREGDIIRKEITKAGDPLSKVGLIGAFCRTYAMEDVLDKYLDDVYEKTSVEGRYTYKQGSVAGGLVTYDSKFAYSHHETDPAGGRLRNAFDLVRIHKFGLQDEGKDVNDYTKLPSYKSMIKMVEDDPEVRKLITKEKLAETQSDFAHIPLHEAEDAEEDDWMTRLDMNKNQIRSSSKNIVLILENDPKLKGAVWHDLFSGFDIVDKWLPWDTAETAKDKNRTWSNADEANLRVYLDSRYDIQGAEKIRDSRIAVATKASRHPIRDYLNGLSWDGIPRLDKLIIDYVGAQDNELTRVMTRKHFVAAVARVMNPGVKYDYCLILAGEEGAGKSTIFREMASEAWFSDSLTTMEGKDAMDQLRSGWLIELAELTSVKKSEVEMVKSFISRQDDKYRPAYGTVTERHPRQCVFCGTTNEQFFLKGDTGNRRFWVVPVFKDVRKCSNLHTAIAEIRDQLWAEAVHYYRQGEKLYLDPEMEALAKERQKSHNENEDDPMVPMLEGFLETLLPSDWNLWSMTSRRNWLKDQDPYQAKGEVKRDRMCPAEFICECLGRDMSDKEYKVLSRKVNKLMEERKWEKITTMKTGIYGTQRGWRRPQNDVEDDNL